MDYYNFLPTSDAFLERARHLFNRFDETGHVPSLLYAALELRYGIERRLYEYLEAELDHSKDGKIPKNEYSASKLLSELLKMEPLSTQGMILKMRLPNGEWSGGMSYTPMTRKLAKDHGKLGEMLHAKFFRNNLDWYVKGDTSKLRSKNLDYYRKFLNEVAEDLEQVTKGDLLTPIKFSGALQELREQKAEGEKD